jgi:hypothetical protein
MQYIDCPSCKERDETISWHGLPDIPATHTCPKCKCEFTVVHELVCTRYFYADEIIKAGK